MTEGIIGRPPEYKKNCSRDYQKRRLKSLFNKWFEKNKEQIQRYHKK